uniref:Calcium/calmodulin-dependent protein kinase II association-domain domain-containing protein n=1 Tax=Hemiselmis tepida TaxID=464990 RepID=A0A7S0W0K1_9CRYP|mmetsp:Transcript_26916/g.68359  ORF Transcript_26916/g.68359 Transcript_26916/m.68359 type:complete len:174 (+) Transcript_26916:2-523(+)
MRRFALAGGSALRSRAIGLPRKLAATPGRSLVGPAKGAAAGKVAEVQAATEALLKSVPHDWATYETLCDADITCFEPEAVGYCAKGLPFHKFYFDLFGDKPAAFPPNTTLCDADIRILSGGKSAVMTYTRLVQKLDADGAPVTAKSNETRVFEQQGEGDAKKWVCVHFHRSPL